MIKGNDAAFLEAIRLIRKFFPESQGFISDERGLSIWEFVQAMSMCGLNKDFSCEPYGIPEGPDLGLQRKGGFEGSNDVILQRLLEHTGYQPAGRVVVVPDALGKGGWAQSNEFVLPFVCDSKRLFERLRELDHFTFGGSNDTIFTFETGEALAIDHDERFYWAKSLIRRWKA